MILYIFVHTCNYLPEEECGASHHGFFGTMPSQRSPLLILLSLLISFVCSRTSSTWSYSVCFICLRLLKLNIEFLRFVHVAEAIGGLLHSCTILHRISELLLLFPFTSWWIFALFSRLIILESKSDCVPNWLRPSQRFSTFLRFNSNPFSGPVTP